MISPANLVTVVFPVASILVRGVHVFVYWVFLVFCLWSL